MTGIGDESYRCLFFRPNGHLYCNATTMESDMAEIKYKRVLIKLSGDKAQDCAWAWNFSGKCPPGQIEYVGFGADGVWQVQLLKTIKTACNQ